MPAISDEMVTTLGGGYREEPERTIRRRTEAVPSPDPRTRTLAAAPKLGALAIADCRRGCKTLPSDCKQTAARIAKHPPKP